MFAEMILLISHKHAQSQSEPLAVKLVDPTVTEAESSRGRERLTFFISSDTSHVGNTSSAGCRITSMCEQERCCVGESDLGLHCMSRLMCVWRECPIPILYASVTNIAKAALHLLSTEVARRHSCLITWMELSLHSVLKSFIWLWDTSELHYFRGLECCTSHPVNLMNIINLLPQNLQAFLHCRWDYCQKMHVWVREDNQDRAAAQSSTRNEMRRRIIIVRRSDDKNYMLQQWFELILHLDSSIHPAFLPLISERQSFSNSPPSELFIHCCELIYAQWHSLKSYCLHYIYKHPLVSHYHPLWHSVYILKCRTLGWISTYYCLNVSTTVMAWD